MTQQTVDRKIDLSQSERNLAKRRPSKTVEVAVINFRGPRGRKYRPIRTAACLNRGLAVAAAREIRCRRYANGAFPTSTEILTVDFIGRVKATETIPGGFPLA